MSVQVTLVLKHISDCFCLFIIRSKNYCIEVRSTFVGFICCLGLSVYLLGKMLRVEMVTVVPNLLEWELSQTMTKILLGFETCFNYKQFLNLSIWKDIVLCSILDKIEKPMFPQYATPDRREFFIYCETLD